MREILYQSGCDDSNCLPYQSSIIELPELLILIIINYDIRYIIVNNKLSYNLTNLIEC